MILVINTIIKDRILLGLVDHKEIIDKVGEMVGYRQAEKLLVLVDRLLKKHNLKPSDLSGVMVVAGPGGFSSIRLSIVLANTLGYCLNIPAVGLDSRAATNLESLIKLGLKKIVNKTKFSMVQPLYGQEPNITFSSKFLFKSKKK